jgi:hypothetical protein
VPGVESPDVEAPDVEAPGVEAPGVEALGVEAPGVRGAGFQRAVAAAAAPGAAGDAAAEAPRAPPGAKAAPASTAARGRAPLPAAARDLANRAWLALRHREFEVALGLADEGLLLTEDPRLRFPQIKVRALVGLGRTDEAAEVVGELWSLREAAPDDRELANMLLHALDCIGEDDSAHQLATELSERYPDMAIAWQVLGNHAWERQGAWEAAQRYFEQGIACLGSQDGWRAAMQRRLGQILAVHQPAEALRWLLAAMFTDGDVAATSSVVRLRRNTIKAEMIQQYLAEHELDAEQRGMVERVAASAFADGGEHLQVYERNLELLVEMSRQAGAVPFLLTYPAHVADVERIQRRVADKLGCALVPIRERIEAELATKKRADLFIPDGHCNDGGYAIMAEMVADALRSDLGR